MVDKVCDFGIWCLHLYAVAQKEALMMSSDSSPIHCFSALSTADVEFLAECSTRYCLGRLSYAPNWMCDILLKCLATLSDGCLSVIERDIREHLQQTEYSSGFSDIGEDWTCILANIQTEQYRRQNVQK